MRWRYLTAIFSAVFLAWIGWNALSPTPNTPSVSTARAPQAAQSPETPSPREPREIIDLSDIFEPIADEDRVPSLNELVLVGYSEEAPLRPQKSWLKKIFDVSSPEPRQVWEFKGGPELPGAVGPNAPTLEIRPGDLPKQIGKPVVE